ncbi:MAG: Type VIII secretion system (T8SS), CsgF protein [Halomonas sp. HL-93]|nr:MAG: Type VIII secretion system (T8SS), CsgF protein [Halomonas sp. HL-93]
MGKRERWLAVGAMVAVAVAGQVSAQDLVYRPVNPSFGGNPMNSQHLLSTASAQRTATASDARQSDGDTPGTPSPGSSDADLFVRQLQGRLLSALAAEVTDAIFGTDPQESGTVTFGTTTVTFERSLEEIRLEIADNLEGSVTEIIVPQLVTASESD